MKALQPFHLFSSFLSSLKTFTSLVTIESVTAKAAPFCESYLLQSPRLNGVGSYGFFKIHLQHFLLNNVGIKNVFVSRMGHLKHLK